VPLDITDRSTATRRRAGADAAAQRATAQLTGLRAIRTNSGAIYHAIPAEGHRWIRVICGAAPGSRSAGWTVTGRGVTCPRCQQRLDERTTPTAPDGRSSLRITVVLTGLVATALNLNLQAAKRQSGGIDDASTATRCRAGIRI
jgi:hypothetical protein